MLFALLEYLAAETLPEIRSCSTPRGGQGPSAATVRQGSGTEPVGDKSQLIEYRDVLHAIREKVSALKKQGNSVEEIVAAKSTKACGRSRTKYNGRGGMCTETAKRHHLGELPSHAWRALRLYLATRQRRHAAAPGPAPDTNAMPPAVDSLVPWQERVRELSLTALLACLLLFTFVVTPLVGLGVIGQLAAGVIWALLGVVSVLVVSGRRATVAVILAATAVSLATAIIDRPTALSAILARGSAAVALAALGGVIGRAAFGPGRVTWHRVQGAVALYLILGLLFAHLYGLLNVLVPEAFANVPPGLRAHAVFYRGRLLYFSLVTLTSVGYGDIVPLHPVAYSLATLEALIGQLFPAILLARLVSLELEGRRSL